MIQTTLISDEDHSCYPVVIRNARQFLEIVLLPTGSGVCSSCQEIGHFVGGYNILLRIKWCERSMLIAMASMQFGRRQLDGDRKRLWRGRKTSCRSSRICRADLNESGTEHQSRTLMSMIVQVSGNGVPLVQDGQSEAMRWMPEALQEAM